MELNVRIGTYLSSIQIISLIVIFGMINGNNSFCKLIGCYIEFLSHVLKGPIINTLEGAYMPAETAIAHGIVITQDNAIFPIKPISKLRRPVFNDPESIHPLAILAPTIPITYNEKII